MLDVQSFQMRTFGSEEVLALVSDKWTIQVLHAILESHNRFGEMRRAIPTITRRMLTLRLRDLERNGLLIRTDFGETPARVEYALTPLGESLAAQLTLLCRWSKQHLDIIENARRNYDSSNALTDEAIR